MIKQISITLFVIFGSVILQAQKFSIFSSDFSILEKNTLIDSSFLVVGSVEYNLTDDITHYAVSFPETKFWEFKDSTLTVYDSLHIVERIDTIGQISDHMIFKKILTDEFSDYDLKENGFTIKDIQKDSSSVFIEWSPPAYIDMLGAAYTKKVKNKLEGVIFTNPEGEEFNKTFFEEYIIVKDRAVPTRIKSYISDKEEKIFKEISLRNVEIR